MGATIMGDAKSFKVGEAPWEKDNSGQKPDSSESFKVGEAPWETKSAETKVERPWYSVDPSNLGAGFLKGLENIDKYTAAPIRKFATEVVTGKEMDHAPSGSEQAKMLGASDTSYKESWGVPSYLGGDISPADIYGVGLEMIQDPLVAASAIKKIGRVAKPAVESVGKYFSNIARPVERVTPVGAKLVENAAENEMIGAFKYKAPQSLEELRQWKPSKDVGQMPGKERLQQIVENVPDLETKPLKYHFDMMENPKSMKELKLKFENLPNDDAKKIAQYNRQIVDESTNKIKSTVEQIVGNEPRSLSDAGNDLIGAVKQRYNEEKTALGPLFNEMQKRSPVLNPRDSHDLIIALGENTKLGKVLEQSPETGRFGLKANTPRTGLSDGEFKVLSRVVDDLNDGMTFEEIQKTREFLRKAIDPSNPGASAEIGKVRSIMLGQLENMAEKIDVEVGKTFKKYAINERGRESFEQIIGGKIESLDAMYSANPEKVVGKIFSNPNYTEIVRGYVGPEKMNEMVGSFIQSGIDKASDSAKGFSPEKFKSWLKRNDQVLKNNLEPGIHQRLNSLADYGYYGKRFLDEVNPSGTAASLKEMLEPTNFIQKVKQKGVTGAINSQIVDTASDAYKSFNAKSTVDEMLGNVKPKSNLPAKTAELGEKALDKLSDVKQGVNVGNVLNREKERKEKGQEKWASDGFKKLNEFANSKKNQELIDVLSNLDKNNKKVKQFLIEASDYKPGSVGFERVIKDLTKMKERQK